MKFALLHHAIVKEFLLALHKGHTHKLKVVVLNKPRKHGERTKASCKTPPTQPVNFPGTRGYYIHASEQNSMGFLSPLVEVPQNSTFSSGSFTVIYKKKKTNILKSWPKQKL